MTKAEIRVQMPVAESLDSLKQKLVLGGRILLRHGVLDAFGHASVRHPDRRDRFMMTRRVAPGLARISDVREFGLDGEIADGSGDKGFLERYIHSSIYRARTDVNAVIHSHSSSVIAFGTIPTNPLRPICHMCCFLEGEAPLFEIRDAIGDGTNLLIADAVRGDALAEKLGTAPLILMRGHGSTVVGQSIEEAVFRAKYLEENARIQALALSIGSPVYLSPAEARAGAVGTDLLIERTWEFWVGEVGGVAAVE
jgi:ribulose-5-phosphate 4-epimerase/fuculose-1-phosphate aldolase